MTIYDLIISRLSNLDFSSLADHSDAAISQESGNQMGRSAFFGEGGQENMRYSWLELVTLW